MSDSLCLVSGSTGFLGSHVTRLLQRQGYRVRGTVRSLKNEAKVKFLYDMVPDAKHKLELVEADLLDAESWKNAVKDCEFVHHVASPFPLANPKSPDEIIKPAVEGTLNVLRACAEAGTVKRVILTSSCAAVSRQDESNTTPFTEATWAKEDETYPYGMSKIRAEREAWKFVEELPADKKFELAVVNPNLMVGTAIHSNDGSSIAVIRRLMEREMPMVPQFYLNMVDVENVALAHLKCMTLPEAAGNRHICIDTAYWYHEMAEILSKEFHDQGYNVPTKKLSSCLFKFAALFDKEVRAVKVTEGKKPVFDNTRMRTVLGIEPKNMEKVLITMAYSLIERGFIKKSDKYRGPENSEQLKK